VFYETAIGMRGICAPGVILIESTMDQDEQNRVLAHEVAHLIVDNVVRSACHKCPSLEVACSWFGWFLLQQSQKKISN
jgi:hypothetical protein